MVKSKLKSNDLYLLIMLVVEFCKKCTVRSTSPNLLLIVKDVGMLVGKPLNLLIHSLPYYVSS